MTGQQLYGLFLAEVHQLHWLKNACLAQLAITLKNEHPYSQEHVSQYRRIFPAIGLHKFIHKGNINPHGL